VIPLPALLERVLAPGADEFVQARLATWLARGPRPRTVLDVGAGCRSLLRGAGLRPIGVDIVPRRVRAFTGGGSAGIVATATVLPFTDRSIDLVWSCGLLHHLPDAAAAGALREMLRVLRPGGRAAVVDGVLPEPAWRRPFAWAVRRADRGRFMRTERDLSSLLPERTAWRCARVVYARTGLEALWCTHDGAGEA